MSRPRPRCAPTIVFCRRCLQPVGKGCRNLNSRHYDFGPVELYPVGIFHGCRIEDAENLVTQLEKERIEPCTVRHEKMTFRNSTSEPAASTKNTANDARQSPHGPLFQ
jgi:hypothetical protein